MRLSRRTLMTGLCAPLAGAAAAGCRRALPAGGGACPSLGGRRLRWIVPNAAGGGYDTESRLLQPLLERRLGADIVIDNQAGAGGLAGARAIARARPDGRTLGIIGVPGLLVAALTTNGETPDPSVDFTVLGRVSRSWHVWATGAASPLATLEHALASAGRRPLLCALNEVGSASFVSVTATAALLDTTVEFVSGFAGTRSACLAAMRGDVDLVCFNFETIRGLLRAGDLRPLLQVSHAPIDPAPVLAGVPVLAGAAGFAAAHAQARGRNSAAAAEMADGVAHVMSGGRLVVAPPALPPGVERCLAGVVADVLASDALRDSTSRRLDPASADVARRDVERAARLAPSLVPHVRAALARLRG